MALQFEDLSIRKLSKELTLLIFGIFENNKNYIIRKIGQWILALAFNL